MARHRFQDTRHTLRFLEMVKCAMPMPLRLGSLGPPLLRQVSPCLPGAVPLPSSFSCCVLRLVPFLEELDDGRLALRQLNQLHTHEPDELAKAAEIAMSASGKTLYATNRGEKDSSNTAGTLLISLEHERDLNNMRCPR